MTNPFAPLGSAEGIDLETLNGALLVFDVLGYETGITTIYGEKDAVRVNVGVVDGPRQGETIADTLLFGGNLIGRLKGLVGQKTCGRLTQGMPKQAGHKPPWILLDPTEQDIAAGAAFITGQAQQQLGGQPQQQAYAPSAPPQQQAPYAPAPGYPQQAPTAPAGYPPQGMPNV